MALSNVENDNFQEMLFKNDKCKIKLYIMNR